MKWLVKYKRKLLSYHSSWKSIILLSAVFVTAGVYANPVVDNVAAGNVSIQQAPNSTVINQSSQKAIINWQSFNIGQSESTHFQQPAGGAALNRISPTQGPSSIYGRLTATGQIILMNPAGIFFGPSAYVNVGGLIATTGNMTDQNFLNGNYQFSKVDPYSGSIVNEGQIIAAEHGLIALVGQNVVNKGLIQANLGTVVLASGNAFTMNFDGSNLISFTVDEKATGDAPGVTNTSTGSIIANGGKVLITAKAAQGVLDNVINLEGVVQARSVAQQNGEIILSGDTDAGVVQVAAKIDASGKLAGEKGGKVKITGHKILVKETTKIDVSGDAGGGEILIGGNFQGKGPLPNASATIIAPYTTLIADAITNGNGGDVIVWSDDFTNVHSNISARGGAQGGDGGLVETSSHNILTVGDILVDTSAPLGKTGTWLLDPSNVTISGSTANGAFGGGDPNTFTPTGDNATVDAATIVTNLDSANVTITTTSGQAQTGNITVSSAITNTTTTKTLLLNADGSITISAGISLPLGALQLTAASNVSSTANLATGLGLTVTNGGTSSTISGGISGSGGLTKAGSGSLTLSAANTYTGATNINAGTLKLTSSSGLGTTSSMSSSTTVGAGTTLTLAFSGGTLRNTNTITLGSGSGGATLRYDGSGQVMSNPIVLANDATITGATNASQTLSGQITGSFGFTLSSLATSIDSSLFLSNANNTYTGATIINHTRAILAISNAGALGNGSGSSVTTVTVNAGTLDFTFNNATLSNTNNITINGSGVPSNTTIKGALFLAGTGATISNNIIMGSDSSIGVGTAKTNTLSGVISGNFALTKERTGTLVLSGSNTYSGSTTVTAGTLSIANATGLGTTAAGTSVTSGAALDINGAAVGAETITLNGTGISSAGALTGTGTSSLSGDITLNANSSIGGTGTLTLSGIVSESGGARTLTKVGSGTITLSGNNTYTGSTTVSVGTLSAAHANALGTTAAGTSVTSGAALNINSASVGAEAITINGTGISSGGALTSTGTASLSGDVTLGANSSIGGTGTLTLSGILSGGFNLTKVGSSTLTLSGTNTYTGTTTIDAGTLTASNSSALGGTAGSSIINNGSTLNINGVAIGDEPVTINSGGTLSSSNTASLGGAITLSGTNTMTSNTGSVFTLSGAINGAGALSLQGLGSFVLSGNMGNSTRLSSITSDANLSLAGGSVATVGDQSYTGTVTLGADTTFSTSGAGNVSITFNNGIAGNKNVTLAGGATSNETFMISGAISANTVTVTGGSSGSNTLAVNTSSNQTWNVNSNNAGSITGISGIASGFNFSNIHNLTGTSNANNDFIFANNATLSGGTINGGSLSKTNTLNYSAYGSVLNITLASTNSGTTRNGSVINLFDNINNLVLNNGLNNSVTLPAKSNTLTITGAAIGFINDPIYFSGFRSFRSTSGSDRVTFNTSALINATAGTAIVDGVTLTFYNFGADALSGGTAATSVSNVLQQPVTNETQATTTASNSWVMTNSTVAQNITDMIDQVTAAIDEDNNPTVNTFCSTGG